MSARFARQRHRRRERGASSVEYSLIVVAIAAIIVAVVFAVGRMTEGNFGATCNELKGQITTVSYGEERPVAEGSDEGAYSQNRRVELVQVQ